MTTPTVINPGTGIPFAEVSAPGLLTTRAPLGAMALCGTTAGAVTVKRPSPRTTGATFAVLDRDGAAGSHAITVDGDGDLIDGASTVTITAARSAAMFVYDGSQWRRVVVRRRVNALEHEIELSDDGGGSGGGGGSSGAIGQVQTSDGAGGFAAPLGFLATDTEIVRAQPLIGRVASLSPYAVDGVGVVGIADADAVIPANVYCFAVIRTTGLLTNDRTITIPAAGAADPFGYLKWIENDCTGAFALIVSTGAGASARVINGFAGLFLVDSRGVTALLGGSKVGAGIDSFVVGRAASAGGDLAIAIGAQVNSPGTAAVGIGESLTTAGTNGVNIGFNSSVSGTYAAAIGTNLAASGPGSFACGVNTNSARPGQFSHNSGHASVQGNQEIDLYSGDAAGVPVNLFDTYGGGFFADTASYNVMLISVACRQLGGGTKRAAETHILVFDAPPGPAMTLDSDTTIAGVGSIAAQGWSLTIAAVAATNELTFTFNPGADTARCIVRTRMVNIGNVF